MLVRHTRQPCFTSYPSSVSLPGAAGQMSDAGEVLRELYADMWEVCMVTDNNLFQLQWQVRSSMCTITPLMHSPTAYAAIPAGCAIS